MLIADQRVDVRGLTNFQIAKAISELQAEQSDRDYPNRRSDIWWEVYRVNDHGEQLVGIVGCKDDDEAQEVAAAEWAPKKVETRPGRNWIIDLYLAYGVRFGSPHLGGWRDSS